eukprot:gb/GECG01009881.1/.p1 GENE.gb/GECG01009881.1/~~gb/GECG01009881.1/.p1  ORF type:complete len:194 (+),score=31.56 gb/GECG01009881.1/:1-582(+)
MSGLRTDVASSRTALSASPMDTEAGMNVDDDSSDGSSSPLFPEYTEAPRGPTYIPVPVGRSFFKPTPVRTERGFDILGTPLQLDSQSGWPTPLLDTLREEQLGNNSQAARQVLAMVGAAQERYQSLAGAGEDEDEDMSGSSSDEEGPTLREDTVRGGGNSRHGMLTGRRSDASNEDEESTTSELGRSKRSRRG